jgi:hypothetical protein
LRTGPLELVGHLVNKVSDDFYAATPTLTQYFNRAAGMFGRITTQAGTPRIIQFGIKYDF